MTYTIYSKQDKINNTIRKKILLETQKVLSICSNIYINDFVFDNQIYI